MNRRFLLVFTICCTLALPQRPTPPSEDSPVEGPRLPDGRSQREEILKADHKKSLEDAAELSKAAEDLKADLERDDRHVLSVSTLKKIDTIEKLAKRIRSRLKRF